MIKQNKLIKISRCLLTGALLLSAITGNCQPSQKVNMKKKILFVVTSHDKKGNSGEHTGYYLSEVSHPWKILKDAGYEIDFVSPQGGTPPVDGFDLTDPENKEFWEDQYYHNKITHSLKPEAVTPEDYVAIHFAGGHGAMWDLPDNEAISAIAAKIYEHNGIVSAVCHGPAGIINIKLSNGHYLIEGKKLNGFSNEEEYAVQLEKVVPFLLENKLKERGGIYEKTTPWHEHVVTDQRLITGQNPQSAKAVGKAVLEALKTRHE
jgi:putative intracellular protease/amidase